MPWALDVSAFHFRTPEDLWRASCSVASNSSEQAEWLHEMAVDLLDIRELPEVPQQPQEIEMLDIQGAQRVRDLLLNQQQGDEDIPF